MHLHGHLRDCIENFGSVNSFWLFSFEQYNGLLESINTNNHDIEAQIMNEFDCMDRILNLSKAVNIENKEMKTVFDKYIPGKRQNNMPSSNSIVALSKGCADAIEDCKDFWHDLSTIFLPKVYKTFALDADDKNMLVCAYRIMYPNISIVIEDVATVCKKFKSVHVAGELFCCEKEKYNNVIALWGDC